MREIIDEVAAGKLAFNLKLMQAEQFLAGMHKIANRITVGVVIAALLIASSMMMRVPTRLHLFGYPALAMIGYLLAAAAGLYLIVTTFLRDRADSLHHPLIEIAVLCPAQYPACAHSRS